MKRTHSLLAHALATTSGATLVLDDELRVVLATPEVEKLLGFEAPLGASAPALLCGDGPKRPVAEALAAGRSVQALIPRPGGGEAALRVRSIPIREGRVRLGWVLSLRDAGALGAEPMLFHGMWTRDAKMKRMFQIIERAAADDVTVLVRGETGAGKELVAHALHARSSRAQGRFQAINCAALPATLLESELFGHVKGAFTGAQRDTIGHIQLAHGGTLFLDEVAEVPLELQAKLLRVIETRSVIPLGAREPIQVDVRIVAATHRALRAEVEAGRFRADLMYRLRVIPIYLPPLRERVLDVSLLVEKLIEELNARGRRQVETISAGALHALESHDWPGNVRELRNALQYAYVIGEGPVLEPTDLPPELAEVDEGGEDGGSAGDAGAADVADPTSSSAEARRITQALGRTRGHKAQAARLLGISRITLWRRMRELGMEDGEVSPARPGGPSIAVRDGGSAGVLPAQTPGLQRSRRPKR